MGPTTPPGFEGNKPPSDTNKTPVADAGPDAEVTPETLVTLDGSGSWDDQGNPKYEWTSSDPKVKLSDPNAVSPTFTAPTPTPTPTPSSESEVWTFSLKVTDSQGKYDSDGVTITVVPPSPEPGSDAPPTESQ